MSSGLPPGIDPATTPLGAPPPGVTPDFSAQGSAPSITILLIVLLVLNTLFTAVRVYTRAVALRTFGWDDGFLVAAWASIVVHMTFILLVLRDGFGRHIWNIPLANAPDLFKEFFVLEAFSCIVYLTLKLTFLITYRRIFSPAAVYRWAINGGIIVCTLFYVGSFLWEIFKCKPLAKSWNPFLEGTCASEFVPGGETGIFNVISDVYILLLPIPMIWKLQTNFKRKLQLLTVFSVGLFTTITSIIRLAQTIIQAQNPDQTYALGQVIVWALLEYSVGLMVVCTFVFTGLWNHVLREPLMRYWSTLKTSTSRGSGSSGNSQSKTFTSDSDGTCHSGDTRFEKASHVESGVRSEKHGSGSSSSFLESESGSTTHVPLSAAVKSDTSHVQGKDWARLSSASQPGITATTTTTVSVSARGKESEEDDRHFFEGVPPPPLRSCSRASTLGKS